jgi:hypothetical protein
MLADARAWASMPDFGLTGRCEDDRPAWDRFGLLGSSLGHSRGRVLDTQEDTALSATGQTSPKFPSYPV